jgi:hypothetical protein
MGAAVVFLVGLALAKCGDQNATAVCGDGECQPGETLQTCFDDCNVVTFKDSVSNTPPDISLEDQSPDANVAEPPNVPVLPAILCGDGVCACGEYAPACATDCTPAPDAVCGDGICQWPPENSVDCAEDCPSVCGDGLCAWEHPSYPSDENPYNCPQDCGGLAPGTQLTTECGDGVCSMWLENNTCCPQDCPTCGNGWCEPGETASSCPGDCAGPISAGNQPPPTPPGCPPDVACTQEYFPVFDCVMIGAELYEWYGAQVTVGPNGEHFNIEYVDGPHQGDWQPFCLGPSEGASDDEGEGPPSPCDPTYQRCP